MNHSEHYLLVIKAELKRQKIRYVDLAGKLGLSESGLKKVLNSSDISFARLQKILDVLGLSLSDFESLMSRHHVKEIELTEKQQKDLIENFDIFSFYWKLVIEGEPLEKIKTDLSLNNTKVAKALRKLDELKLLSWKEGESFKKIDKSPVRWTGDGPLLGYVHKEWGKKVIEKSLGELKGKSRTGRSMYQLKYLTLTEAQITELIEELVTRGDELSVQSAREAKIRPKTQLLKIGFLLAMTPMQFV